MQDSKTKQKNNPNWTSRGKNYEVKNTLNGINSGLDTAEKISKCEGIRIETI